ncbi:DUF6231 family protein [Pokkaliibacter sp. CJK22405]|uniref:DUF6231 family protein n=1 Tax=Pokkaliibacter sp. CJK22405 TaxID=3384615 RepID=UPI003985070C
MTPNELLLERLQQKKPQRLLCLGPELPPAVSTFQIDTTNRPIAVSECPDIQRAPEETFDLVLVSQQLEQLPKSEGKTLIGRLRHLFAPSVWVCYQQDDQSEWQDTDFYSLGMTKEATIQSADSAFVLYAFDLLTYNHVRSWNNANHWANPQNWGKYWW